MEKIKTKWLCIITIFEFKEYENENEVTLEEGRNLWIGTLLYEKYSSKNLQIVIIRKRWSKTDNKFITKYYEKKNNDIGYIDIQDSILKNDDLLVEIDATKELFKLINSRYESENIILITLGHGGVFGINPVENKFENKIKDEVKSDDRIFKDYLIINDFLEIENAEILKALLNSEKPKKIVLNNRELAESLVEFNKKSKTKPIDIFVSSNCFMQNIFAQYDFHHYVDYYVAPISGISYPSYNILDIFRQINSKPTCTVKEIATLFVDKKTIESHKIYTQDFTGLSNEEIEKDAKIKERKILSDFAKKAINERWFIICIKLNSDLYKEFALVFKKFIDALVTLCIKDKNFTDILIYLLNHNYNFAKKSFKAIDIVDLRTFAFNLNIKIKKDYNKVSLQNEINSLYEIIVSLETILSYIQKDHYIGKDFLFDMDMYNDKYFTKNDLTKLANEIGFGFYFTNDLEPNSGLHTLLNNNNKEQPLLTENTNYLKLLELLSKI